MENIKLIALDVDGTLTDGKIYYDSNGNEMKTFDAKDGMVISQASKHGIDIAIITGRNSSIVERRSKELGVKHIYQGIHSKVEALEHILNNSKLTCDEVMYIGDDINDIEIMRKVKYSACPADAVNEVKEISNIISSKAGGNGAVREIIETVLKKQDKWANIISNYRCCSCRYKHICNSEFIDIAGSRQCRGHGCCSRSSANNGNLNIPTYLA